MTPSKTKEQKRETKRRWNVRNREKLLAYARAKYWRDKLTDPAKPLAGTRRRRGLPLPTRLVPAQCECCGGPSGKHAMHLDHCHETGKFRGWICNRCNLGIGALGDNLAGILRAAEYLRCNA